MTSHTQKTYYQRYCEAARRFQLVGVIIVAGGILLRLVAGAPVQAISFLIGAVGVCVFLMGSASLRTHNVVKSFAQQCVQNPDNDFALGLLEALESSRRVQLVSSSITLVENAIAVYAQWDGADASVVQKLQEAFDNRVKKKIF